MGLEEFTKFYPKKLSGGLLRRLNIACGIAHKPELIIFDEPTVAVDPQSRNKILEGIKTLNQQGATIIYTSHYMEEVEQICSKIAIIDKPRTSSSEGAFEQAAKDRIVIPHNIIVSNFFIFSLLHFITIMNCIIVTRIICFGKYFFTIIQLHKI
mgnify:CR=1 FL=1